MKTKTLRQPSSRRTSAYVRVMSALPPKADIAERDRHVRFVPKADMATVTAYL
jgi:hypothetical protein